jgi:flavin reductase (DIM6/NTAB) family NADH-FMN oxidoreductase RutF
MLEIGAPEIAELKNAFGQFPTGVVALCALSDGRPVGLAASSFTSVSLDPPLVSVCLQNTSRTWPHLRARPRIGLSVLGEDHQRVCRQLAATLGDRFAGIGWHSVPGGAVFIAGAPAWLDCKLYRAFEAGDHEIAVLYVNELSINSEIRPLVFHASRFRQLAHHE